MEIVSVRSDLQEGSNSCSKDNGGCTDLCLYRPDTGHICACGDQYDPLCSTGQKQITSWNRSSICNISLNEILLFQFMGVILALLYV